jgi:hypothetical protein
MHFFLCGERERGKERGTRVGRETRNERTVLKILRFVSSVRGLQSDYLDFVAFAFVGVPLRFARKKRELKTLHFWRVLSLSLSSLSL